MTRLSLGIDAQDAGDHLFDLNTDPNEQNDLFDEKPEVALTMRLLLDDYMARSYSPLLIGILGDWKKHQYKVTLSTTGTFATETLRNNSFSGFLTKITSKEIVLNEERDGLLTWFSTDSFPMDAEVVLRIKIDGEPMPASDIYVGNQQGTEDGLIRFRSGDDFLTTLPQASIYSGLSKRPLLWLFRATKAPSRRYTISPDARQRMKELGYF